MRNLQVIKCYKLAVFLSILVIIILSCKKENDDNSGYYGKWMAGKAVPASGYGGYTKVDYYLTLSNTNSYNESFIIYSKGIKDQFTYVSIDGSVLVLENHMQFNAEKISFSNYDYQKKKVDSPYYITTNNQDIESTLNGLVKVTSGHNAEFSLNGNKLTLSVDYDENGNYLDYDEILIYTRQ